MPISLPTADAVRKAIGARAAKALSVAATEILERIGPIVPSDPVSTGESAWRVAYCHGTYAELRAIEAAASDVRRATPFIALSTFTR